MNTILYIIIMNLDLVAKVLFLAPAVFFFYHGKKYLVLWWNTPSDQPVVYGMFTKLRRQTITMLLALAISVSLPSKSEAIAQYIGYKVANASVWDRMFQNAGGADAIERLVK